MLATADDTAAMERTVALHIGTMAGAEFLFTEFMDYLVHSWDLAIATRLDATLDPVLAKVAHTLFQTGGLFGPGDKRNHRGSGNRQQPGQAHCRGWVATLTIPSPYSP